MGKRKKSSRGPQGPKKRDPLPSSFRCVFCNHETAVSVKIDKKAGVGNLSCKSCGQHFQCGVNSMSGAVDVYADWIDACDAVAKEQATTTSTTNAPPAVPTAGARGRAAQASSHAGGALGEKYTAEDDGFIVDDEPDGQADYADED